MTKDLHVSLFDIATFWILGALTGVGTTMLFYAA